MNYRELFWQVLADFRFHKLRSGLALLGIAWGTFIVVMLLALAQSFYLASQHKLLRLADGTIHVWAGKTSKAYQGHQAGQRVHITADVVMAMPQQLPLVKAVSPHIRVSKTVSVGTHVMTATIKGVSAQLPQIDERIQLAPHSRFISVNDVKRQAHTLFLGYNLKQSLFGDKEAIGHYVKVAGVPYLVVGYLAADAPVSTGYSNSGFIPYTSAFSLTGNHEIYGFLALPTSPLLAEAATRQIKRYLSRQYYFNPDDPNALHIYTSRAKKMFSTFFAMLLLFFGFTGLMTLAVGGIGVANMMYLIINDRRVELGLRMALGATARIILKQVLSEGMMIVFLGGLLGLLFSEGLLLAINALPLPPWLGEPQVSLSVFLGSFLVLSLIALAASYFPAKKASTLEPVDALRM